MDPYGHGDAIEAMAKAGVAPSRWSLMPRITRAQVMDVLSSQANLAGYRAVIDAAAEYGRAMPMMMTPAGTVPAARAVHHGRRRRRPAGDRHRPAGASGAMVTATDVRPATKEQVESLGAKFVAVEDEEFKQAETAGGYAKEMSDAYKAKQAALVATHIAKQDIVVTTALIPGRPAPRLITADMVKSMRGLGDRRSRGRARRQLRALAPGRIGDHRQRREDRRLFQRHPARRLRLGALRAQSLRLRRDADRQGDKRSPSTGTTNSSRRRA
jgi:NAD/NADP transhydrogenase alpha subunit